jgi:N-acetylglucosamine kinase-like BadF-type ATPase
VADSGDPLATWVFNQAGKVLAKHIVALSPSMSTSLHESLSVVCIGSVWRSWKHLEAGFLDAMAKSGVKSFQLLKLKVPMATGACYLAANNEMSKNYNQNTEMFFKSS